MEENKKQDRNFELRSEKVRSIVGQIPSSLVRYGTTAIGLVLLCLFFVAYFLPYKQVYSGKAVIHEVSGESLTNNIEANILLKFGEKHPHAQITKGIPLTLYSTVGIADGTLLSLSSARDTLGRQKAFCSMPGQSLKNMENSEVDFLMTVQSGNLLNHFFSGLFGK